MERSPAQRRQVNLKALSLLLCTLLVFPPQLFAAPPVPSGATGTTVSTAGNGVPVVNIATPSAAGLSHNTYTSYNVDTQGLVLNNGDKSTPFRQSQLGGQVAANPNLVAGTQASIILNEVTGGSRSSLLGFTEVLGGKADVIVANPFGITCNGCGFINTDKVSLVTGTPNVAGGALSGFTVNGGDILVSGSGINASAQQILNLVSRGIVLSGQVNAPTVNLLAGRNTWDYATGGLTALAPGGGAAPSYAIDSSSLGGMYAGRISLKATEAGVGVRMQGEAAATADDFTITSAGKIELRSTISAARDMTLSSSDSAADAIKAVDASLSSGRNLGLTATSGGATLSGGALVAAGGLNYTLGSLADGSTATAVTDNNKRYGSTVALSGSGAWTLGGVNYGSAGAFQISGPGSLTVNAPGTALYSGTTLGISTTGSLAMGDAALTSAGDMALSSTGGAISFTGGAGQGVKVSAGSLSLAAATGVTNAGTLTADAGGVTIRSGGTVSDSGTIHAAGTLDVADASGGATEAVSVAGGTLMGGTLNIKSASLSVSGGGSVESAGALGVTTGTLSVGSGADSASRILAASGGSGTGSITASTSLDNYGTVYSKQDLTISAATVTNRASGLISASSALNLTAASGLTNAGALATNSGAMTLRVGGTLSDTGAIHAAGALDVADAAGGSTETVSVAGGKLMGSTLAFKGNALTVSGGGSVESAGTLTLSVASLALSDSTSRILAASGGTGTGTVTVGAGFSNNGLLYSGQNLSVSAPWITNTSTGGIAAGNALTVAATGGALLNQGFMYAGSTLSASASGDFTNYAPVTAAQGSIESGQGMTLTAGGTFTNNSNIIAGRDISITAPTFKNEVLGGDTRAWSYQTTPVTDIVTGDTGVHYSFPDDYRTVYHKVYWSDTQYYSGGTPLFAPKILGGSTGTVSISGFGTGKNLGALISGGTVNITGSSGAATFTNDNLALVRNDYYYTYERYWHWIALGPLLYDENKYQNQSATVTSPVTLSSLNGGIRATTLHMGSLGLVNAGSPYASSTVAKTATGATDGSTSRTASGTAFPGLVLTLPSNPNGKYVTSVNPSSGYLVETNPLYTNVDNFLGSDYLAEKYSFKADDVVKRLGDAGYETYLVKQQLATLTGFNSLSGYATDKTLMQGLMDHAGTQAKSLGLVYGQALSASQQAGIKEDMVWMVETVVGGQKVLAPVVYLAASTRSLFDPGAASISAETANLAVTSLTNTGGTISGSKSLAVTSQGDITNVSGTITGGDVSLVSTQGGIVNKTLTLTTGDDTERATTVGKRAGIVATGNLNLDAARDITNLGAKLSAGGDASLVAGGSVTLDTVENKSASASHAGLTSTSTSTTEQVRSELSTGGSLTVRAKNDVTLAGAVVDVGGNAAIDAGNNLNILARDNTSRVVTSSETSGFGVGGGLYGTEKTTTDAFKSRVVGTTINVGGDASLSAGKTATLQGASVNAGGSVDLSATDVKVVVARDVDRTTTTTQTQTFLSLAPAGGEGSTTPKAPTTAPGPESTTPSGVSAQASAATSYTADGGGIDFSKTTTTSTYDESTRAVGSGITAGKNVTISAKKNLTMEGANVSAKGDVGLSGENVNIMAAQDTHVTTSSTSTTRVGLYGSTSNVADAGAGAQAGASAGATGAKAGAEASAHAGAATSNNLDVVRTTTTDTATLDITNKGSSVAAGGTLTINSGNKLTVQGSDLSGDKAVDLKAKDMSFQAAQDVHTSSTTTSTTSAGLYLDGNADASAKVQAGTSAGVTGVKAGVSAEAQASARLSVGFQGQNTSTTDTSGTSTARVSSIKSGSGSITRTAENSITDVGTSIDAAGDFAQSSKTFTSKAAENTSYSTHTSETNTAKLGVYAKAEAGVSAEAGASAGLNKSVVGASAGATAEVNASVGAGITASYSQETSSSGSTSSQAVVSGIRAGGKVGLTSTDKTSLEGTKISGGTGVTIDAGSLDYTAAKNTSTSTSSSGSIDASASVGISKGTGGKGVDVDLSGGTAQSSSSSSSSQAVAGGIESGGGLTIRTRDDARFVGTGLSAKGDTTVAAGGSLTMEAARDTSTSSSTSYNAAAGISTSTSKGKDGSSSSGVDVSLSGGYGSSKAESSTAQAGTVTSGGSLTLSSGKAASFEGTKIEAGGDATISARQGVTMSAAKSTASSESLGVQAGIGIGVEKEKGATGGGSGGDKPTANSSGQKSGSVSLDLDIQNAKSTTAEAGSVKSGGNLKVVSGGDTTLEGTDLSAGGKATLQSGGSVILKTAESTTHADGVSLSGSLGVTRSTTDSGNTNSGGNTARGVVNRSVGARDGKSDASARTTFATEGDLSLTNTNSGTSKGATISAGAGGIEIQAGGVSVVGGASNAATGTVGTPARLTTDGRVDVNAGGGATTLTNTVIDAKGGSNVTTP